MFEDMPDREADLAFTREQLMEPAKLIPDHWIAECSALGSVDKCVAKLQEYKNAGAHELTTYGSSPGQNATLLQAWRKKSAESVAKTSSAHEKAFGAQTLGLRRDCQGVGAADREDCRPGRLRG
jgi:hypothetical protein